ncbi:MAG: ketoacyl-ACP synthase III [Proteobacteria bacterium]|jgi:3-oxoacyl-[acyl-carrier-protein] synthase-3|nr:ketoacyl-ACP synthase III [Pseudomonadota bacterium]
MNPVSSVVRGVGHHVPSKIVTNMDLSRLMDTSDEWIIERTGIRERRFVEEGTTTSDLAVPAVRMACARAGVEPQDCDMIIAATLSPDYFFPGIGTVLQNKLGMKNVPALDIRAQCSGLVYGLATADAYLRAGLAKRILLVCSEVQSPILDKTNRGRDMAVLFGDGAGALVIEAQSCPEGQRPTGKNTSRGVIDSLMGSDGSGAQLLFLKAPGSTTVGFMTQQSLDSGDIHPKMDGRVVFKNAVTRMLEAASTVLERNGLQPSDIDLVLPHQANLRINEAVREKLGISEDKVFNNIQKYGNTTAATIPICMSEAHEQGKIKEGQLVMTLAFGAGFTWGCNLIRW